MQTLECPKDKNYLLHQSDTLIPALGALLELRELGNHEPTTTDLLDYLKDLDDTQKEGLSSKANQFLLSNKLFLTAYLRSQGIQV